MEWYFALPLAIFAAFVSIIFCDIFTKLLSDKDPDAQEYFIDIFAKEKKDKKTIHF